MKWIGAVLLVGAIGCVSSEATPEEKLQGNWALTFPDGLTGVGLEFDGSDYVQLLTSLTSSNAANAEIEKGDFFASDTHITFVPREWSCSGPDPIYTVPYTLAGSSLSVTSGSTLFVLERNLAPPATNFLITTGCTQAGAFVPMPLSPVKN